MHVKVCAANVLNAYVMFRCIDIMQMHDKCGNNSVCLCRSMSRGRALSAKPGKGLKDATQQNKAVQMSDKAMFKRSKMARKGEGDRHIPTLRPKHLLSGKRGNGKTDRR